MTAREREIREREAKATEGPWDVRHGFRDVVARKPGRVIAWGIRLMECDAEFIAAAREDVPYLLAEVDRLRAALSVAKGMLIPIDINPDDIIAVLDGALRGGE